MNRSLFSLDVGRYPWVGEPTPVGCRERRAMPPSSGFRLCLPGCRCEIHCQEASPDPEDGVEDEEVGPDDRPLRRPAHVADDAVSVICSVAEGRRLDGTGQEDDPVQGVPIPVVIGYFAEALLAEFDRHSVRLRTDARARREAVLLRNVVADREMQQSVSVEDSLGKRQPGDEYQGDINLRTLRTLLSIIDGRGFERSAHQARLSHSPPVEWLCLSCTPVRADALPLGLRARHGARGVPQGLGVAASGDHAQERVAELPGRGPHFVSLSITNTSTERVADAHPSVPQNAAPLRQDFLVRF